MKDRERESVLHTHSCGRVSGIYTDMQHASFLKRYIKRVCIATKFMMDDRVSAIVLCHMHGALEDETTSGTNNTCTYVIEGKSLHYTSSLYEAESGGGYMAVIPYLYDPSLDHNV